MGSMSRRQFLGVLAGTVATVGFGASAAGAVENIVRLRPSTLPIGSQLLDAHAHPDNLGMAFNPDGSPLCPSLTNVDLDNTLAKLTALGLNGSSFAAIGDLPLQSNAFVIDFDDLKAQLNCVLAMERAGKLRIVRRVSDIPSATIFSRFVPGAVLSVEGAAPLGMGLPTFDGLHDPDYDPAAEPALDVKAEIRARVTALFNMGVRLVTLMHYRENNIGSTLSGSHDWRHWLRLTKLGEALVERMFELGMIVDVAHASRQALEDVAGLARLRGKPIIDSHVSLSYEETLTANTPSKRLRPWDEMEMIAATGGVVCTWPLKVTIPANEFHGEIPRTTIRHWAEENYLLKKRLGFRHIGLGTDGCGLVGPNVAMVDDWHGILNLVDLADEMRKVGFNNTELAAYMGGNLLRVMWQNRLGGWGLPNQNFQSIW